MYKSRSIAVAKYPGHVGIWFKELLRRCIVLLWACFVTVASLAHADDAQLSDVESKAALLVNLPKYVDWPSAAFVASNSPIVIIVLGNEKVGEDLVKLVVGKTVKQRSLEVRHAAHVADIDEPCHILFVSASKEKRLPAILEKLKGASVLTVGECDDFLDDGGMINLARRERRIRMEINLTPARNAGLKISSRLFSVAAPVKGRGAGP